MTPVLPGAGAGAGPWHATWIARERSKATEKIDEVPILAAERREQNFLGLFWKERGQYSNFGACIG